MAIALMPLVLLKAAVLFVFNKQTGNTTHHSISQKELL